MAKKKKEEPRSRRPRRGIDQRIAELEAKINAIKEREARRRATADPALRHASAALRSIDKALAATKDGAIKKALGDARESLGACLAPDGAAPVRRRRSADEIEGLAEALLAYVRSNPGQRGEQIAAAMSTDTQTIRPVMKKLIADGKVVTEGQKRGMTYDAK